MTYVIYSNKWKFTFSKFVVVVLSLFPLSLSFSSSSTFFFYKFFFNVEFLSTGRGSLFSNLLFM